MRPAHNTWKRYDLEVMAICGCDVIVARRLRFPTSIKGVFLDFCSRFDNHAQAGF
jgi:hypothetical protein